MHNGCTDEKQGSLLAAYELGVLDDEQKTLFEAHLLSCQTCIEELYAGAPVADELQAHPGLYAKSLHTETATEGSSLFEKIKELFSVKALVPVAVVASLVVMVISLNGPNISDYAVVEKMAYTNIDVRNANSSEAADFFEDGMRAYQKDSYEEAVGLLNKAVKHSDSECKLWDYANLYLGVSYMLTDKPVLSIKPLTAVSESNKLPMVEKGNWLIAQAYLQSGNREEAEKRLISLSENSVGYTQKAIEQLKLLAGN